MGNKSTEKKITRGIDKEFADAFKKCKLYTLYEDHKDELFIGVRNNYLNLYYNCDSIAKIEYKKRDKRIVCEIDKYYIDGKRYNSTDKEKRFRIEPKQICEEYDEIKTNSEKKSNPEKKAQSKLVISNNNNEKSNWFCIDIEYIKQFNNNTEKEKANINGRFDIIAISKEQPHRVALIELKYASSAFSGKSGIYKHIKDFIEFNREGFFESHLRQEIIEIIKSQKNLGISVPFELPQNVDLLKPEFYFITLDNNAKGNGSTPKQSMSGYLFNDKRWECKRLSTKRVETDFGDVTKEDNNPHIKFLFSTAILGNIEITDIIDDGKYERE